MAEALEQMLNDFEVPSISNESLYTSIDMYAASVPALYTGDFFEPRDPLIRPRPNGFVIPHPPIDGLPEIKDYHDTYKIDRYDNPYGGHTTFNIPGFPKKRIDHGDK